MTGNITQTNFTVSSSDGSPVNFEDIDLNGMKVIVNSESGNTEVLGVTGSNAPGAAPASTEPTVEDIMALMTPVEDEDLVDDMGDEVEEDVYM